MKPLLPLFALTALGLVVYHLGQKLQPTQANPMVLLMGVYGVAFLLSAAAAPFFPTPGHVSWVSQLCSWPVVVVAVGALLIELGFLLVYRSGGSLQLVGVGVNALGALLLVPLAILWFREHVSFTRLAGMVLALAGLALMAWKRG